MLVAEMVGWQKRTQKSSFIHSIQQLQNIELLEQSTKQTNKGWIIHEQTNFDTHKVGDNVATLGLSQ